MTAPHWTEVLELRPEVIERRGHPEGLQMSLFDAVYETTEVPYRDTGYWCDITEPTVKLTEFFAEIGLCLSDAHTYGQVLKNDGLFHLDQGMGGGKSHALCGLWHMATNPEAFFESDIGKKVDGVAEQRSAASLQLEGTRVVVLCADHFSPGVARPEFGPATNLHQRFLWSLFNGDRELYDDHVGRGTDKAAIKDALAAAGRPVLILLDEIMDYALALSQPEHAAQQPSEQGFLNSLTEVVNTTDSTAMVVVMIRSDLDEQGYDDRSAEFRGYLSRRLERNGTTVSVNEPQDFGAIIRRRIFTTDHQDIPATELTDDWTGSASSAWHSQVFDKLPGARQLSGFAERLGRSYPFHPDLLDLIEHDWTSYSGFQRVRSTVEIFAATAYWWSTEKNEGRWSPPLLGLGDIPLHAAADEVLASGVLHGNENQRVGLRQIAEKDVTSTDRTDGQAVLLDGRITDGRVWAEIQPQPAVRIATALWMYSVVTRAQATRGATKAELLAAVYVPDEQFGFGDAEEVFNALTDDEDARGLGALDVIKATGGGQQTRYVLATEMNKRLFQRNALNRVTPEMSYDLIWERATRLASTGGSFDKVIAIGMPEEDTPLSEVFGEVDQQRSNRLVVLHPKRWTLLNGRDNDTRADLDSVFGLGDNALGVDWAATCVVACVNTQRRDMLVKKAKQAVGWRLALAECSPELALREDIEAEARDALKVVDAEVRRAYQHYAFLVRAGDELRVEIARIDSENRTSLSGNDVWDSLAEKGEAVRPGSGLAGSYLHKLVDVSDRAFTLKEVVEKFWRDPAFPMVPNETDVRAAIFDALNEDSDGVAWEVVDANGDQLNVTSPDQLAITGSAQQLRFANPQPALDASVDVPASSGASARTTAPPSPASASSTREPAVPGGSTEYLVYDMELPSTSLSNPEYRDKLFQFISEVGAVVDPASDIDVQLAGFKISLTVAVSALEELERQAKAADVRFTEAEEDF